MNRAGDIAAAERLLPPLRIHGDKFLQNSVVAGQISIFFPQVDPHRHTVLTAVPHDRGPGRCGHSRPDPKRRRIPVIRKLEQPHGGIVYLPCSIAVRGFYLSLVRIQIFVDMVVPAGFAHLTVCHPKTDRNLGYRLGIDSGKRVLPVVSEGG